MHFRKLNNRILMGLVALLLIVAPKLTQARTTVQKCAAAVQSLSGKTKQKAAYEEITTPTSETFNALVAAKILKKDGTANRKSRPNLSQEQVEAERDALLKIIHTMADDGLFANGLDIKHAIKAVQLLEQMQKLGIALPDPNAEITVKTPEGEVKRMKLSEAIKYYVGGIVGGAISKPFVLVDLGIQFTGGSVTFTKDQVKRFTKGTVDMIVKPRILSHALAFVLRQNWYPFLSPFQLAGGFYQSYHKWRYKNWHWDKELRPETLIVKRGRIRSAFYSFSAVPSYVWRDWPILLTFAIAHKMGANLFYLLAGVLQEDGIDDYEFEDLAGPVDDSSAGLTVMINLNRNPDPTEPRSAAELGTIIMRDKANVDYYEIQYPTQLEIVKRKILRKHGKLPDKLIFYGGNTKAGVLKFPQQKTDASYFAGKSPLGMVAPGGKVVLKIGRIASESGFESGTELMDSLGKYLIMDGGEIIAPVARVGRSSFKKGEWTPVGNENHYGFVTGPWRSIWESIDGISHQRWNLSVDSDKSYFQRVWEGDLNPIKSDRFKKREFKPIKRDKNGKPVNTL